MATRGRKPKPTAVKRAAGNRGKRRLRDDEPAFDDAEFGPPDHLSLEARDEWIRLADDLAGKKLLSSGDVAAFAAYCQAYGRWVQAERALQQVALRDATTAGLMIRTSNGNIIQNPLLSIANRAMSDVVRCAAEFGLTPSSRARMPEQKTSGTLYPYAAGRRPDLD